MTTIIAGRLDTFQLAEDLRYRLHGAGFEPAGISTFMVNPAGQHDAFPVGGDQNAAPGSRRAHVGAVAGAGVGAVLAGAAAAAIPGVAPILTVAAAGAGAYTGSLAGSLAMTEDVATAADPPSRSAGVRLAISVYSPESEVRAIQLLRECGADEIERGEGELRDGEWIDFDPLAPPIFVDREDR